MHDDPAASHPVRMSRRDLLRLSAAGAAGAFLAATSATQAARAGSAIDGTRAPGASPGQEQGGVLQWASWIGYMPTSEDGTTFPVLDRFTEETGIIVSYQEVIEDHEEFYASWLEGPLEAGASSGWDLVTLSDWMMQRLIAKGWLEPVAEALANYPANLLPAYRERSWDPGNRYAVPYQSGMTGLGFDRAVTGPLRSVAAFFDPQWAGRMTYQAEMSDTVGLAALQLGLEPSALDQAGFDAALAAIGRAVDEGLPRPLGADSYVDLLAVGEVVLAMAWAGDVATLLVPFQGPKQDFAWVLPSEGGMLWTDNLAIPRGAEGKAFAEAWIDHYYRPQVAAEVAAFVQYVCPVKGAADEIAAFDPGLAGSPLIFPDAAMSARLHTFVALEPATRDDWQAAFAEVMRP